MSGRGEERREGYLALNDRDLGGGSRNVTMTVCDKVLVEVIQKIRIILEKGRC